MFPKIKEQIKELARNAVLVAEAELGSGRGEEKKQKAIEYVLSNLRISGFLKTIISIVLSGFIDNIIEISVEYMKSLPKTEGE